MRPPCPASSNRLRPTLLSWDKPLQAQQIGHRCENPRGAECESPRNKRPGQSNHSRFVRKSPHWLREQSAGNRTRRAEILSAMACRNGVSYSEPQPCGSFSGSTRVWSPVQALNRVSLLADRSRFGLSLVGHLLLIFCEDFPLRRGQLRNWRDKSMIMFSAQKSLPRHCS
jgi:hypothetical protein